MFARTRARAIIVWLSRNGGGKDMETKKDITFDERVKAEIRKLSRTFSDMDGNRRSSISGIIKRAAFYRVKLEDLEAEIAESGIVEEYQHGENQSGRKQTVEVQTQIAMTKNLTSIEKTLAELAPPKRAKKTMLEKMRDD